MTNDDLPADSEVMDAEGNRNWEVPHRHNGDDQTCISSVTGFDFELYPESGLMYPPLEAVPSDLVSNHTAVIPRARVNDTRTTISLDEEEVKPKKLASANKSNVVNAMDALERGMLSCATHDDLLTIMPTPMPLPSPSHRFDEESMPGAYPMAGINSIICGSTGGGSVDTNPLPQHESDSNQSQPYQCMNGNTSSCQVNNHSLVEARPVEEPVVDAEELMESDIVTRRTKTRQTNIYLALIAGAVILLGISLIVSLLLLAQRKNNAGEKPANATTTQGEGEVIGNTNNTAFQLHPAFLRVLPNYTQESILQNLTWQNYEDDNGAFDDGSSANATTDWLTPQYKAYQWLRNDPYLESYSDDRLLQRFVLATFFFSTSGHSWTSQMFLNTNITNSSNGAVLLDNIPVDKSRQEEILSLLIAEGLNTGDKGEGNSTRVGGNNENISSNTPQPWLFYDIHECDWWSMANANGYTTCRTILSDNNSDMQTTANANDTDASYQYYVSLYLADNNLAGEIPPEIGLLSTLEVLYLGHNERMIGTIQSQIGQLTNLRELHLGVGQYSGTIPTDLVRISDSLQSFSVMKNQLTGTFPKHLLALSQLELLKVGYNQFEGTLPPDLGTHLPHLQEFSVPGNQFNGTLPLSLVTQCKNLTFLDVSENALLTGTIYTELGSLEHLTRIFFAQTSIHGTVPSQLSMLSGLTKLSLRDNGNLTGQLPPELEYLNETLTTLQIQGTSMTGSIPESFCGIKKLKFDCSDWLCGCDCPC